jgi:hypothetical protein
MSELYSEVLQCCVSPITTSDFLDEILGVTVGKDVAMIWVSGEWDAQIRNTRQLGGILLSSAGYRFPDSVCLSGLA